VVPPHGNVMQDSSLRTYSSAAAEAVVERDVVFLGSAAHHREQGRFVVVATDKQGLHDH